MGIQALQALQALVSENAEILTFGAFLKKFQQFKTQALVTREYRFFFQKL